MRATLVALLVVRASSAQPNEEFGPENSAHMMLTYRTVTRDEWRVAEIADTDAGELTAFGEIVMARDETAYMRKLVERVAKPGGKVLEIGFGMGISAAMVQRRGVARHVIVEANAAIGRRCLDWATNGTAVGSVTPVLGFWEDITPLLTDGSFDGILFDAFPESATPEFIREARRLLAEGGVLTYYLQQWGDSGAEQWEASRGQLLAAGFADAEIRDPTWHSSDIRSDCGARVLLTCPMARITFIVPHIVKGGLHNSRDELR